MIVIWRILRSVSPAATLIATVFATTPAAADERGATLDELLAAAKAKNPMLAARAHEVSAAGHEATRAGAWMAPMIGVMAQNLPVDSWRLDRDPMSMLAVELRETLPLPGKTADRAAVAGREAEAMAFDLAEAQLVVSGELKSAFYELTYVRQNRTLTAANLELINQLVDTVRAKYAASRARQDEYLRLEMQQARLRDDLAEIERQDTQLLAAINSTTGRPIDAGVHTDATLPALPLPADAATTPTGADHRPAMKALQARHRGALDRATLAAGEAWPDPTVVASYGIRSPTQGGMGSGTDMVSFGVSFALPVNYGSTFGAEQAGADARAAALLATQAALTAEVGRNVAGARADWRRAEKQAEIYDTAVAPAARRVIDAVRSSYETDQAEFIEVYEAAVALLETERTLYRARVETYLAAARLELAIGTDQP
ncbi:MAG: TolC family protein [Deltaproteobacteria bacterium]|nr:TolC family protein [Deltaproteobacteria bacterium]